MQWTKEAERATQLEDRVMALSNQLSMQGDTESKLATLKERVAVVTRMNNEKTARIKALEDSAEKKDQLVKEWSRAIEVYESEVQRVTEENQRLLTEIELSKSSLRLVLKLAQEARADDLDSDLVVAEDSPQSPLMAVVSQLRDAVADLSHGLEVQRELLEQRDGRHHSVLADFEALKKKKELLELELEQVRISAVGRTASGTGDLTDKSATAEADHDRVAQLETYLASQADMANQLGRELDAEREQHADTVQRLEQAVAAVQQLEAALDETQAELQRQQSIIAETEESRSRLKEEKRRLAKQVAKVQEELAGMSARKRVFEREAAKDETQELVDRVVKQVRAEFESRLQDKDDQIRRLRSKTGRSSREAQLVAERDRLVEEQDLPVPTRSRHQTHKSFGRIGR